MNPSPTARLTPADRRRRDWYVSKVDLLAQDVPSGYRKARRRELRSETRHDPERTEFRVAQPDLSALEWQAVRHDRIGS